MTNGLLKSSYMRKYLHISSYIRKPFLCNCTTLNTLIYCIRKISISFFISVMHNCESTGIRYRELRRCTYWGAPVHQRVLTDLQRARLLAVVWFAPRLPPSLLPSLSSRPGDTQEDCVVYCWRGSGVGEEPNDSFVHYKSFNILWYR